MTEAAHHIGALTCIAGVLVAFAGLSLVIAATGDSRGHRDPTGAVVPTGMPGWPLPHRPGHLRTLGLTLLGLLTVAFAIRTGAEQFLPWTMVTVMVAAVPGMWLRARYPDLYGRLVLPALAVAPVGLLGIAWG